MSLFEFSAESVQEIKKVIDGNYRYAGIEVVGNGAIWLCLYEAKKWEPGASSRLDGYPLPVVQRINELIYQEKRSSDELRRRVPLLVQRLIDQEAREKQEAEDRRAGAEQRLLAAEKKAQAEALKTPHK